jgi:hypothetical protein
MIMKRAFLAVALLLLTTAACLADRPIFLVTPAGVFQSVVDSSGKPGTWAPIAADVIIQGFSTGGPTTPNTPAPPSSSDPAVVQITALSKAELKDKDDAVSVAALIESIAKLKLSETDFKQSLEMAAPIVDASLGANGRITDWAKKALLVTADPAKLKAGLAEAWGVEQSTLDSIHAAAATPNPETTAKAVNWAALIAVIQAILTMLTNLGIKGA